MDIIVRITRPQLTHEERVERMKAIKKAAANLVVAQIKKEKKKNV